MEIASIIGLILSVIALIGVIWRGGIQWASVKNEIKGLKESVEKVVKRLDEMEPIVKDNHTKIAPFWQLVTQNLQYLFNVPRSRNLLEKIEDNSISNEELIHLEEELKRIQPKDNAERLSRLFSLWAISVKKTERGLNARRDPE